MINALYGQAPDALTGWKFWHFYLKTGLIVSFTSPIPNMALVPGKTWKDYLFKDKELSGLWLLGNSMPKIYLGLSARSERPISLHRIPDGYDEGPEIVGVTHTSTEMMGDKVTGKSFYITLTDGGAQVDADRPLDVYGELEFQGRYLYDTLPHELTHVLDYLEGIGAGKASDTSDWLDLSGWYLDESVDATSKKVTHTWAHKSDGDGYVRSYAETNPTEDFAETSAWTRFQSDLSFQRSPKKSVWLSKKYVAKGLSFTDFKTATLVDHYAVSAQAEVTQDLLGLVSTCMTSKETAQTVPDAQTAVVQSFTQALPDIPHAISSCMASGLMQSVDKALDHIRLQELEACRTLETPSVYQAVLKNLLPEIQTLLTKNDGMLQLVSAQKEIRQNLDSQIDPREIYVHCRYKAQGPPQTQDLIAACYDQGLESAYKTVSDVTVSRLSDDLKPLLTNELGAFKTAHPYETAQTDAYKGYQDLLDSVGPALKTQANTRWDTCVLEASAAPSPGASSMNFTFYDGGETYVNYGILICLNTTIPADIDQLIGGVIQNQEKVVGKNIDIDVSQKSFFQEILLPKYRVMLEGNQAQAQTAESASRDQAKPGVIAALKKSLEADSSWVATQGAVNNQTLCAQKGRDLFSLNTQVSTYFKFVTLDEVRAAWVAEACQAVGSDDVSAEQASVGSLQASTLPLIKSVILKFVSDSQAKTPMILASETFVNQCAVDRDLSQRIKTQVYDPQVWSKFHWLSSDDELKTETRWNMLACTQTSTSREFQVLVQNSHQALIQAQWPGFESAFKDALRAKYKECQNGTIKLQVVQKRCLSNSWEELVTAALDGRSDEFQAFAKPKLETGRTLYLNNTLNPSGEE